MKLMGNHFFASSKSKSRKVIVPSVLKNLTQATQTIDCIARSRHVMLKCVPDTTNCSADEVRKAISGTIY